MKNQHQSLEKFVTRELSRQAATQIKGGNGAQRHQIREETQT